MKLSGKDEKEQEFYYCTTCGNVMIKLNDSGITPQCCSRTMIKVVSGDADAAIEKHVPLCEKEGSNLKVKVGSIEHPMEKEHFIEWIFVKTNKGFHVVFFTPEDEPKASFALQEEEVVESVYAKCNLHGIWKSKDLYII